MSKKIEIVCVACGSRNIVQTPDGRWQCLDCGFKWGWDIYNKSPEEWNPEDEDNWSPEDEEEEENYPDSEDGWSEEEDFWFE